MIKLITPRMGEGVTQVTVVKWLKNEGDSVKEYEPLVEVETDKVITEIPSPAAGVLAKILLLQNQIALVGQTLAEITSSADESIQPLLPTTQPAASSPPVVQGSKPITLSQTIPSDRVWLSPLVAKIAADNQVDLAQVPGSGSSGRVTKQDLMDYLASHQAIPVTPPPNSPKAPLQPHVGIQPLTPIRRRIAERMLQSIHTAPHVLTVMEADLSRVLVHLNQNKERFSAEGIRLTLTAYFIAATAKALRAIPIVNASWTDEGIQIHPQINIGVAVSLGDAGLIVPVIRDVDQLSLVEIALAVNDLANRARANQLKPEEVRGGTFSLTNHGIGGSLFASPIINQPQIGILGTGALQKRPIVISDQLGNDSISIRPMIYLSFVFDHRILDGATSDQFLLAVKKNLESPLLD